MILSLLLLMGMQATSFCAGDIETCRKLAQPVVYGDGAGKVVVAQQAIFLDTAEWCEKSIHLGKLSKKLSEIFPEECPQNDYPPQAPHTLPYFTEIPPSALQSGTAHSNVIEPEAVPIAPEPLEVPAIQEPDKSHPKIQTQPGMWEYCGIKGRPNWCSAAPPDVTTCADKTRILEHDEQPVPLYWCRRVQK